MADILVSNAPVGYASLEGLYVYRGYEWEQHSWYNETAMETITGTEWGRSSVPIRRQRSNHV